MARPGSRGGCGGGLA